MSKWVLFGATGAIGRSVAEALRQAERPYRVVGRSRAALEQAFGGDPLAEIVTWDSNDPASARRALAGATVAFDLVGSDYYNWQILPPITRAIVDAAVAEKVQRVLLAGTTYVYGPPRTRVVTEDHPRDPTSVKGRIRVEQEDAVLGAHARGQLEGVVVRMPDFYGPGVERSLLARAFRAALKGMPAPLVAPIDTEREFLFTPDAGAVFAALGAAPGAAGQAFNLGGVGPTTQRQMVELAFKLAGHRPMILPVGPTMRRLAGLFDPILRELDEVSYTFTSTMLLDDSRLRSLLGSLKKTSYQDGVTQSLDAFRGAPGKARLIPQS
jgi:nucleoside-diphosphate-sugar epimerase